MGPSMNNKLEYAVRAGVALFAVFILAKVFFYFLKSFFENTILAKKEKEELEEKIEKMVAKIKQGSGDIFSETVNNGSSPSSAESKPLGNSLDLFYQKYKSLMAQWEKEKGHQSPEVVNLKEVLKILDNARWGSGSIIQQLTTQIIKNLKIPESSMNVAATVNELVREELFVRNEKILPYGEIMDLIKSKVTLELLFQDAQQRGKKLCLNLAEQYSLDADCMVQAFELFFWKHSEKSQQDLLKIVLKRGDSAKDFQQINPVVKKKIFLKILFTPINPSHQVAHFTEILHHIKKQATLIEEIIMAERNARCKVSGEDLEKAYQSLGCEQGCTEEQLKTAFNKLAKRSHPDRMSRMNLSSEKLKDVNERFAEMKNTYDLLKADLKERKKLVEILQKKS